MIVISGRLPVRSDQRDRAVAAATALMTATQAEEGCAEYTFSADLADPDAFCFFERWESEDALKAHQRSAHMKEFMGVAAEVLAGAPEGTRYDVSGSAPLF
jgi:quinol monooxygenase YgiN